MLPGGSTFHTALTEWRERGGGQTKPRKGGRKQSSETGEAEAAASCKAKFSKRCSCTEKEFQNFVWCQLGTGSDKWKPILQNTRKEGPGLGKLNIPRAHADFRTDLNSQQPKGRGLTDHPTLCRAEQSLE